MCILVYIGSVTLAFCLKRILLSCG
ncbi:rCG60177 [Rattus norvegicus]|uniref:RCG60177 n=1 Tax=Rattus norvegicus TaxID=10116 RepID=A6HRT8_RAT|nr:rCG60177 [Rattus norvegicus]